MPELPLPPAVLYVGLAGVLLSLLVATWQQNWQCRVFFLLALRLAIGWQFLFEGLYKIHSVYVGPNQTTRAFTSEPYFKAAAGPLGPVMRKQFDDPEAVIEAKVKAAKSIAPEAFARLSAKEQAAECPEAVAKQLDTAEAEVEKAEIAAAEKEQGDATTKAAKDLAAAKTDEDKAKARAEANKAQEQTKKRIDAAKQTAAELVTAAKATYARWVYGVDGQDAKLKGIAQVARLTATQRLAHLETLRREVKEQDDIASNGLGNGYGHSSKKAAELRADLQGAEADLAKDANTFVSELNAGLGGKPIVAEAAGHGKLMDKVTMWFLVGVGACLMAGLLTRVACVLAAGFLIMTYLSIPAFPWLPQPPMTEGNPIFVNKNIIECLALLALACMPTGRWMGLDALLGRICCPLTKATA